ncbi:MAG TPA: hypothetical protein VHK66_02790 [Microvirga sp.]|nr:hypothetical protein [Microvirga sp.]
MPPFFADFLAADFTPPRADERADFLAAVFFAPDFLAAVFFAAGFLAALFFAALLFVALFVALFADDFAADFLALLFAPDFLPEEVEELPAPLVLFEPNRLDLSSDGISASFKSLRATTVTLARQRRYNKRVPINGQCRK